MKVKQVSFRVKKAGRVSVYNFNHFILRFIYKIDAFLSVCAHVLATLLLEK